jgi:hypothetical protein
MMKQLTLGWGMEGKLLCKVLPKIGSVVPPIELPLGVKALIGLLEKSVKRKGE